jgi:hypothetical protein
MKISVKTITYYLLFVGLPLLGVVGALWSGRSLAAPASVGGAWALLIPEQPALKCQAFAGWKGEMQMVISQSGPNLLVIFGDPAHAALTGILSGLSITAENIGIPQLQLAAEVDREADPHQLSGSLQVAGCAPPLDFTGYLQPDNTSSQEH